jgi:ubiquinone/menaquinone biosynthesis C-methylase UbiE
VDAVDIVPEMIEMTRSLAVESKVDERVACHVSDATPLHFDDEQFDVVLAVGLTNWLATIEPAIREITRVLKPGGHVIVTDTNPWSLQFLLDPVRNPLVAPLKEAVRRLLTVFRICPPKYCYSRSNKEVVSAMECAGLHRDKLRNFGFGPFTLFGWELFSARTGWAIHSYLQKRADRNWPVFRSTCLVYIALATKPLKSGHA